MISRKIWLTPIFWIFHTVYFDNYNYLRMYLSQIHLATSDGSNTILLNIVWTRTSFFEHWVNTLFLASNKRKSNNDPNRVFTRFTKLLIELTWTSFFQTLNKLQHVHLLVIELEHPIFGIKRLNIELQTLFDSSLFQMDIFRTLQDPSEPF